MRNWSKGHGLGVLTLMTVLWGCEVAPEAQPPADEGTGEIEGSILEQDIVSSACALEFGEGNVLFVGDSRAGVVHAFDFDAFFSEEDANSAWVWGAARFKDANRGGQRHLASPLMT